MTLHIPWREAREWIAGAAWVVAIAWLVRTAELVRRIGEVPDIAEEDLRWPERMPTLGVIVPAKDEGPNLRATLEALEANEYTKLKVLVVDDRSSDSTGWIAEEFARRVPERFEAIHIHDLPEGWLGKTWALDVGTQVFRGMDVLLFTDADVLMSPSILWRALRAMELLECDHLVVMPTPLVRSHGEGMVLGFFTLLGNWATRFWRVPDPKAKRDVIGVGAFNMVRTAALDEIGGWMPQRMVVIEDVTLGRRIKAAGLKSQVAVAPGRVLVHWAAGANGIVRVMTKNVFSTVNFRSLVMLGACVWIALFMIAPCVGVFWPGTMLPCALILLCVAAQYRTLWRVSSIDPEFGWLMPAGAAMMIWAMLRSMAVVLWQGGVVWRGTHYPLRELRRENSPFRWDREAAEARKGLR